MKILSRRFSFTFFDGNRLITNFGSLPVGQAMEDVDVGGLHQSGNRIADVVENILIPFHARTGGQERGEGFDRRKALHPVGTVAVDACDGSQLGFHVAIARGFAAPRTAVDVRLSVDESYDRIVVVHEVASLQISQPHAYLSTLSGSAFGDECISISVLSYQGCVDEESLQSAAGKGEDEHQGVVQSEATHVVVAVQGASAVAEVLVGLQQTAAGPVDVLDDILVSAIVEFIDDGVSISCIKGSDAFAFFLWVGAQGIVNRELKKKFTLQIFLSEGF